MFQDGNGELSKEEFINGALQDKELLSAFAISEHMIEPSHWSLILVLLYGLA